MKLPSQVRDTIILSLDEYLETINDQPDAAELAEQTVSLDAKSAEEADVDEYEEVLRQIEEEQEMERVSLKPWNTSSPRRMTWSFQGKTSLG